MVQGDHALSACKNRELCAHEHTHWSYSQPPLRSLLHKWTKVDSKIPSQSLRKWYMKNWWPYKLVSLWKYLQGSLISFNKVSVRIPLKDINILKDISTGLKMPRGRKSLKDFCILKDILTWRDSNRIQWRINKGQSIFSKIGSNKGISQIPLFAIFDKWCQIRDFSVEISQKW